MPANRSANMPRPTQYRFYRRRFLQVKRPNQHYQSTEGKATKEKSNNVNNKIHICTENNGHKKGYRQNKHDKSPSQPRTLTMWEVHETVHFKSKIVVLQKYLKWIWQTKLLVTIFRRCCTEFPYGSLSSSLFRENPKYCRSVATRLNRRVSLVEVLRSSWSSISPPKSASLSSLSSPSLLSSWLDESPESSSSSEKYGRLPTPTYHTGHSGNEEFSEWHTTSAPQCGRDSHNASTGYKSKCLSLFWYTASEESFSKEICVSCFLILIKLWHSTEFATIQPETHKLA